MPREPSLTFTIPSIHDGTVLDCKVFHPPGLGTGASCLEASRWRRATAVLAHPYAPLGGSYDDPIIEMLTETLLKRGYVVGTFNFRGAGHSAGKTSWTAKPEQDDYASVIGFITYYAAMIDITGESEQDSGEERQDRECLLLGGYSYGSILTALLPPLGEILSMFETPKCDSDASQIRLRAESLAEQQNTAMRAASQKRQTPTGPSKTNIRIGGDEGCSPRKSHESSRKGFSLDDELFKKGVHDLIHKRRSKPDPSPLHLSRGDAPAEGRLPKNTKVVVPKAAYLLISPLQGVASHLVTLSALPSAMSRQRDMSVQAAEDKLVKSPTLAVYGDSDVFAQLGKMRTWASRLEGQEGSLFKAEEVETAGHFWAEEGVLQKMLRLVDAFAKQLIR